MKAEIVNMVVRIFEVILALADLKRKMLQNQRGLERGGKEGTDFGDLKLQFLFKQTTRALKLMLSLLWLWSWESIPSEKKKNTRFGLC